MSKIFRETESMNLKLEDDPNMKKLGMTNAKNLKILNEDDPDYIVHISEEGKRFINVFELTVNIIKEMEGRMEGPHYISIAALKDIISKYDLYDEDGDKIKID